MGLVILGIGVMVFTWVMGETMENVADSPVHGAKTRSMLYNLTDTGSTVVSWISLTLVAGAVLLIIGLLRMYLG